jgi:short-subunit dehydrogenase
MGPYAASKFALEAASDSLRRELLPFGVDVIVVEPGSVHSRIWEKIERMDLSLYRGTPYEGALDRFRSLALRSGERGLPAVLVARAVARALTARRPPTRILVVKSRLAHGLVQWLPDRLMDWLVERALWRKANRVP